MDVDSYARHKRENINVQTRLTHRTLSDTLVDTIYHVPSTAYAPATSRTFGAYPIDFARTEEFVQEVEPRPIAKNTAVDEMCLNIPTVFSQPQHVMMENLQEANMCSMERSKNTRRRDFETHHRLHPCDFGVASCGRREFISPCIHAA
jgi:hypothetical protein